MKIGQFTRFPRVPIPDSKSTLLYYRTSGKQLQIRGAVSAVEHGHGEWNGEMEVKWNVEHAAVVHTRPLEFGESN